MVEARVFWVAFFGKLRQGFSAPDRAISSFFISAGVVLLTIGLIWFSSLSITKPTAQIIIYLIALFEIILGLRVGMLRIGYRSDEYMISTSSRFWRRAISYLIPAIVLPLPIILATSEHLAGVSWLGWVMAKVLLLNALMFFVVGTTWGILIRRLTRQLLIRAVLLAMSVIAVLTGLTTNLVVFDLNLLFSDSYSVLLTLLIFQASVIAIAVVLAELFLGGVSLTNRRFGRYYPIANASPISGSGPGSTAFYLAVKRILRDSQAHRRLAAVVLTFLIAMGIVYSYAGFLDSAVLAGLVLSLFAVFNSAVVFTISQVLPGENLGQSNSVFKSHSNRVNTGLFLGGLLWVTVISSVLWGIIDLTVGGGEWVGVFTIVSITQFTLASGWSKKVEQSHHQTLSTLTVFGLLILIGLVPAVLWGIASHSQIIFIQLIWLSLTVILLRLTGDQQKEASYA